jgi:Tol biopolymer transport system component
VPRDGGPYTPLVEAPGHAWPFSWSPDGDKVLFAGLRDGAWNVWWVSRSTRREKRLTGYRSFRSYVRYPAWSPRGNQIVYEYGETRGNIYLLDLAP